MDDEDQSLRAFWIFKAAVPHLKPGSTIIATISEQAYDPAASLYDYADEGSHNELCQVACKQFGPQGIRVYGVAPGPIYKPLQISGEATEEHWRKFGAKYPLAHAGQPAKLASIYVQLAAQDASYTTCNIYGAGAGMDNHSCRMRAAMEDL